MGVHVEQDDEEAVRWYRLAVAQQHPGAMNNLGLCCLRGRGLQQNHEDAVQLFRKSARMHYIHALDSLSVCYEFGRGATKDTILAACYCWIAAQAGIRRAQTNLANLMNPVNSQFLVCTDRFAAN
jgi:TPR repeat protein